MQPRIYDSSSNLVMLFLLIAATAAPERGLLFASTGAKPNGCAGHGPPESSKCGAGKENWVCKPTPKPQAPDCRECSDPFVEGIDSACDSDSSGRGNYTQFNYDCPITRVVTYPPECCHLGGAFVVEELHTAVTALLGTPGLESFCSTPGVCKEWANGTGFGTSSNGFAYGIKYTEIGGPNDGQDGCLINREVLNDERLFPNTPGVMGLLPFFGQRDDVVWLSYSGLYSQCDWECLGNDKCNAESSYAYLAGAGYPDLPFVIDKKAALTAPNMVQECTNDDPLDWQAITEATYSMARNPDTSCNYGAFEIATDPREKSEKCNGIDPVGKEKALAIKDGKDLLARFHSNKSSVYNSDV